MPALEIALLLSSSYLLGSLSSAIILSRIMGFKDPRSEGSNNPGATNVMRIAGKKAAFFTLLGDSLKGLLPVLFAQSLGVDSIFIALTAFAAFGGHCFPVFFKFKGGKGVATAIAATLGYNWLIGLILISIWLIFAKVFKISSVAAIIAFACLPVMIFWHEASIATTAVFSFISSILIWRHKSNIQRLFAGAEK